MTEAQKLGKLITNLRRKEGKVGLSSGQKKELEELLRAFNTLTGGEFSSHKFLPVFSMEEVEKHNVPEDCWVVLNGKVYDLTDFHPAHPAGSRLITDNAGKDATLLFNPIHPSDIIKRLLPVSVELGVVDKTTIMEKHVARPILLEDSKKDVRLCP